MKKLKEITKFILAFNNTPVAYTDNLPMTIRDGFLQQLGSYRAKDAKRTMEAYALGMMVVKMKGDDLTLEDAEFNLLADIIRQNPANVPVVVHAPLLMSLDEAEEFKLDEPKEG